MKNTIAVVGIAGFITYLVYGCWPIKQTRDRAYNRFLRSKRQEEAGLILFATVVISMILWLIS